MNFAAIYKKYTGRKLMIDTLEQNSKQKGKKNIYLVSFFEVL